MISEKDLQYEEEPLENVCVKDIQKTYKDEVLLWVRGSKRYDQEEARYYAVLDYRGTEKSFEGTVQEGTPYSAILEGIMVAVKTLKKSVRLHVISQTSVFLRQYFTDQKTEYGQLVQQTIYEVLQSKSCQLSYSQVSGDKIKEWIMSHFENAPKKQANEYKSYIYRECLEKVEQVLKTNDVSPDVIRQVSELLPD